MMEDGGWRTQRKRIDLGQIEPMAKHVKAHTRVAPTSLGSARFFGPQISARDATETATSGSRSANLHRSRKIGGIRRSWLSA